MDASFAILRQTKKGKQKEPQEWLRQLNDKINHLKTQIYETINGNYKEFINTFQCSITLTNDLETLSTELQDLTITLQNPESEFTEAVEEIESLKKRIVESEDVLFVVKLLNQLDNLIKRCRKAVQTCDYNLGASCILEMTGGASKLQQLVDRGCDPQIFSVVLQEIRNQTAVVTSGLSELFSRAIEVTAEKLVFHTLVTGGVAGPGVRISAILEGLSKLQELNDRMVVFADELNELFLSAILDSLGEGTLKPQIENGKVTLYFEKKECEANEPPELEDAHNSKQPNVSSFYAQILSTVEFINEHFLDGDCNVMRLIGEALWASFSERVVSLLLEPSLPSDPQLFSSFSEICSETEKFEIKLTDFGLIPAHTRTLTQYTHRLPSLFATRTRVRALEAARSAIMAGIGNLNTVMVGTACGTGAKAKGKGKGGGVSGQEDDGLADGFFTMPVCLISASAHTLLAQIEDLLKTACQSPGPLALELYSAARDVFDLYRAMALITWRPHFPNNQMLPVLFHNDCMYCAHRCMALFHEYPLPIPNNTLITSFADLVPPLRTLGEETLRREMEVQQSLLLHTLTACGDWAGTDDDVSSSKVEDSLKRLHTQLEALSQTWAPILSVAIYRRVFGTLLDAILTHIIDKIIALNSISKEESHQLHYLLSWLKQHIPPLMNTPGPQEGAPPAPLPQYLSRWEKFCLLIDIVDMGLADIVNDFKQGRLKGFRPVEVRNLICAIFADSALRKQLLDEIR